MLLSAYVYDAPLGLGYDSSGCLMMKNATQTLGRWQALTKIPLLALNKQTLPQGVSEEWNTVMHVDVNMEFRVQSHKE